MPSPSLPAQAQQPACWPSGIPYGCRAVDYRIAAKTKPEMRISRHGIGKTMGDAVVATEVFRFPHTPYHDAFRSMEREYPGCELTITMLGGVK